jgi:hypothetical protein
MIKHALAILLFLAGFNLSAQEPEYSHVFFDNSLMPESWHYSKLNINRPLLS